MKKLFSIILFTALACGWVSTYAAGCVINTANTTTGITPTNANDTLTQGVAYNQTFQVYVPATYTIATVDSVHIDSIKGAPNGGSWVYNPADGDGGTVVGGGTGSICFSATTNSPVGSYPLTFYGNIYVHEAGTPATLPLSTLASAFSYTFNVKAGAPVSICDTILNVTNIDTPEVWTFGQGQSGYLAGNNSYGDEAKAEKFYAAPGNEVGGGLVFFSVATINAGDSSQNVAVNLYDATGAGGSPGTVIATANVTLREIAAAVTQVNTSHQLAPLFVSFTPTLHLTANAAFFIGVVLPTTVGDTVAIFSNSQTTTNGHGWEMQSDGNWYDWDSVYTSGTAFHSGLYIGASICMGSPVAAYTTNPSSVCAGSAVQFSGSAGNGETAWSWSFTGGNPSTSTSQSPSVTYAAGGTYSVKLIVTNPVGNDTTTQQLIVNSSPSATVAITPASSVSSSNGGAMLTVTGGTSPFTYSWSNDNSTSDSIANVHSGTYNVTITDANSCTATASAVVTVTGILALSNNSTVSVYPNPASNVLNLVWSEKSNAEVTVLDLNGAVISTFVTSGDMKSVCDVHSLATGSYILRITDKSNNQQQSMLFSKF